MHVRILAQPPSSHPLFQRSPEVPAGVIRSHRESRSNYNVHRNGPIITAYQTWGKVGMIRGILESLGDFAIEGEISVTVSRGFSELRGEVQLYDPAYQRVINETLMAADRAAQFLSHDPQVREVTVTYSQEIVKIQTR